MVKGVLAPDFNAPVDGGSDCFFQLIVDGECFLDSPVVGGQSAGVGEVLCVIRHPRAQYDSPIGRHVFLVPVDHGNAAMGEIRVHKSL